MVSQYFIKNNQPFICYFIYKIAQTPGAYQFLFFQGFVILPQNWLFDDSKNYICDSCYQANVTKLYNCKLQKRVWWLYQFIYTNLVQLIKPIRVLDKQYFFTFINHYTMLTKTYTASKKSNWLKYLKTYHSFCKIRSK